MRALDILVVAVILFVKQRLDRRIALAIFRLSGPRLGRLAFGITVGGRLK